MLSYDKLESGVMKFLDDSKLEFFDAEELAAELDPQAEGEEKESVFRRVCGILDSCDLVARKHSSDLYYILDHFFRKTVFLCKPREIEIAKGILIPAARFEPFHPAELYPDELELTEAKHPGEPFGLTDVKVSYGEISDLFLMLGPAGTMDMLTAESQENYDNMRKMGGLKDSLPVELEAFDLSAFYENTGFRNGDFLRFEIESWSGGRMTVSHVPRLNGPVPQEINRWIDKFEASLTDVCRDYKDSLEIHEQLTYAYVYAAASGSDVRRIPGPPVDLYQNMMRAISFRRDGSEWTLISNDDLEDSAPEHEHPSGNGDSCSCGCGHEHHHGHHADGKPEGDFGDLAPEDFSASQGTTESIDAILAEIHAPVHEIELQAYMMDTIANGAETFAEFEWVHENLIKLVFADEGQEAAYLNYAEELWEQTFEHYSHNMDSLRAPLRARLLELTDARIELSSALLAYKHSTLPADLREQMVRLHKDVLDTLFVLDRDAVLEEEEIENMELRVGDIEDDYELVSEKVSRWLEQQITKK